MKVRNAVAAAAATLGLAGAMVPAAEAHRVISASDAAAWSLQETAGYRAGHGGLAVSYPEVNPSGLHQWAVVIRYRFNCGFLGLSRCQRHSTVVWTHGLLTYRGDAAG